MNNLGKKYRYYRSILCIVALGIEFRCERVKRDKGLE